MKKLLLTLIILGIFTCPVFADRNTPTITGYSATAQIKTGDWKIYRITFIATANAGNFAIYDILSTTTPSDATIKTEGSEATSLNGKNYDFTGKPLEGSTGLYLVVNDGTVVLEYE